jgi:hypothetical protein
MHRLALGIVMLWAATAPAQLKKAKWVSFTSEPHQYKIKFPKKPAADAPKHLATAAGVVRIDTDRAEADGVEFAVTIALYPEDFKDVAAKTLLDAVRDGLKGSDGEIKSDEPLTLDVGNSTVTGREFRIQAGRNLLRCRAYLLGNKLYQVMVTGPKSIVEGPVVGPFFDSFELKR